MPRDGSNVYSAPAGTAGTPNATIQSSKYNALVADLVADLNAARPITAGGTGETTARLADGTWRFKNTADATKLLALDLSGIPTATTVTLAVSDQSGTIITTGDAAGQSGMESESNTGYVRPSYVKYSPGVAKCWVHCGVAGNIYAAYGVSSVTDVGTGELTVNQSVTLSAAAGAILASPFSGTSLNFLTVRSYSDTAIQLRSWGTSFTLADAAEYFVARYGDI